MPIRPSRAPMLHLILAHRDEVEVQWRSYQLDPTLPEHYDGTELDYLSTRKGMAPAQVAGMFAHVAEQASGEGLNYRFDDVVVANSFTAHRLIHLAAAHGQQDAAKERLLSDHFEHGRDIGSREYLTSLGLGLGIGAAELDELFTTDKYADDVRQDFEEGRALGITGVPFFVIDRKFGLSGAQPAEVFRSALDQAWAAAHPALEVLLLGGAPIREPMAQYGPFVMNTREQLIEAMEDYQAGRLGIIPDGALMPFAGMPHTGR